MKRNEVLKAAFEEAAEKELKTLPGEGDIVRPYSKEFKKKMDKLFDEMGQDKTAPVRRKKIRWAALVAAVLMCVCFGVVAGATTGYFTFGGIKMTNDLRENILDAVIGEGVEEFDAEYEKSTDPFSAVARETGAGKHIILDYTESIEYNNVIDEDDGYKFELKSVTKAKQKYQVMTGGRLSDGSATFEWTVDDGYYAIIETSRCDGEAFTQNEKETIDVMWSFLLEGYSPHLTNFHFRGNTIHSYRNDYKIHYAIEITDMMPFAKSDFALAGIDIFDYENREINKDTLNADEEGKLELVNRDEYFGILLRFSVPEEFASEDEKYAEKYFELKPHEIKSWMKSYQTNAVE